MKTIETDVLIVGAGPAGLTAAGLLAREGIDAITLTKYGTANAPRAHITNQRAVEILRDLGIEEAVKERALPQELMGKQVFATTFAGQELSRMMTWGSGDDRIGEYRAASPSQMCNIAQHVLEPIMLEHVRALGADIRQHHEVLSVTQSDEQVTARVKPTNSDEEFEVIAKYAIGCDGGSTIVGREGEFEYEGQAGLGDAVTVWIEADLRQYTAHRSGALFFTVTPGSQDVLGVWTCVEPWNEWSTILLRPELKPTDLDEASVAETVRAAIGNDDIPFKIKNISPWQFNHIVAANYRQGRLFIAGDAAHRHPPANGLGSNTSMQDTYNLAWKLALVLRGQASEALLDSYNTERQPVGRQIVDRANQSVADMLGWFGTIGITPEMTQEEAQVHLQGVFGPEGEAVRAQLRETLELTNEQFNAHGVELGQRYASGAVVGDGTDAPTSERDPVLHYQPSTYPGSPIPHAWLTVGDRDVSTLDLCDYGQFTLITGAGGQSWIETAEQVSKDLGVTINAVQVSLGLEVNDVYQHWASRREIADSGCVLVRPDRIVAWRSESAAEDATEKLHDVMTSILHGNTECQVEAA